MVSFEEGKDLNGEYNEQGKRNEPVESLGIQTCNGTKRQRREIRMCFFARLTSALRAKERERRDDAPRSSIALIHFSTRTGILFVAPLIPRANA